MAHENAVGAGGIVELIDTLAAEHASGRLDMVAGATEGVLFFKDGKLVDARIGHLTGFQAVNAVASMRDARYYFDPAAAIPNSSSIRSNERLVLKQFFGIETIDPTDYATPAPAGEVEEATLVTSEVASTPPEVVSAPLHVASAPGEIVAAHQVRSAAPYLIAFAVTLLVVALAAAAVLLRSRFRERTLPASVATSSEPVSRPLPAEPIPAERTTAEPTSAKTTPAQTTRVEQTPTEPQSAQQPTAANSTTTTAPNLTGNWKIVNTVHTSAHRGFQNLQIGFALSINQTGKTFTAKGQKVSENGRTLPASSRTPIQLKGFIDGDKVEATFSEQGALRKSSGRFVWKLERTGGGLKGTFASTAAQSSGKSTASREL